MVCGLFFRAQPSEPTLAWQCMQAALTADALQEGAMLEHGVWILLCGYNDLQNEDEVAAPVPGSRAYLGAEPADVFATATVTEAAKRATR